MKLRQTIVASSFVVAVSALAGLLLLQESRTPETSSPVRAVAASSPVRKCERASLTPKSSSPEASRAQGRADATRLLEAARAQAEAREATTKDEEVAASSSNDQASSDEAANDPAAPSDEPLVMVVPRAKLVSVVTKHLSSDDADERIEALRVVRENGIPETSSLVTYLATDDADARVRRFASQVLAMGDPDEHAEALGKLAADPDLGVRANAAYGLALRGDPKAVGTLSTLVDEARRTGSPLVESIEAALEECR
jgi:hypothetical protein